MIPDDPAAFTAAELVGLLADDDRLAVVAALALGHDSTASVRTEPDSGAGLDAEAAKVFRAFVRDGRITAIPTTPRKRRILLDWLAQNFEPGRRYSEAMVNLTLGRFHPDTAAWRRYLVDEEYLTRDAGVYWRSGGSTAID